ncbi:hypothetical protein LWC34_14005 [Kibdelosporangium philippinense]|uniref:DUF2178 domain-containing protein n=1 Tax=Kibdelosporangium philippinense TaxID=211113 RepID=A0ABS8Z7S1_9PSEU|nr:hypothetical protein [Kibdelosporangium philippinense]MCE7003934.1 hypothetical protein [Kibdelosporangium philippinense]
MAYEEKRAWIMGLVTVVTYTIYAIIVLNGDGALTETPYVATMIWTIVVAIVVSIVFEIGIAATTPKDDRRKDQRDTEIGYFGDRIGQSFLVVGGIGAMVLAMTEANHFWIANTIYLAFVLMSVLASIAKIAAYRVGFQQ